MAGKYGSSSITVSLDDGSGTLRNVSQHILEMGGTKISNALELSHAFGDAWEESTPVGVQKGEPIKLGGLWDTTATTGPHVVMTPNANDADPNGTLRTLTIVYGDSKQVTMECRLASYEVMGNVGKLTRFEAMLTPSGAVTWS